MLIINTVYICEIKKLCEMVFLCKSRNFHTNEICKKNRHYPANVRDTDAFKDAVFKLQTSDSAV